MIHRFTRLTTIAISIAFASAVFAPAQSAPVGSQPSKPALLSAASPEAMGFDSTRLQRLDDYMAGFVADGQVAGMTTLLARHGQVVEFKTYGKANLATGEPIKKDTIFRIYSMTKPITGVAMMILFEEGKWRIDEPITRYIPEFGNLKVVKSIGADGAVVLEDMRRPPTFRELMSHTAGFGYGLLDRHPVDRLYRENHVLTSESLKQMIDRTATIPLKFQPGTAWAYSSAAEIQGYIIEQISGQKLSAFLAERIFEPLGMTDTAFYIGPEKVDRLAAIYHFDLEQGELIETEKIFDMDMPDYTSPPALESGGGGLLSTTMDYARFIQMLANKGELDGVRILSPASVELMGTNMIPANASAFDDGVSTNLLIGGAGFGLDLRVLEDARAAGTLAGTGTMSWGGAGGTWFWIDPGNDVIFVGMLQRFGLSGRDSLATVAQTLTYQALIHPETGPQGR